MIFGVNCCYKKSAPIAGMFLAHRSMFFLKKYERYFLLEFFGDFLAYVSKYSRKKVALLGDPSFYL